MRSDRPLTLTVEEAGRLLGVGRSTAYELVRTGELESLRLRRRLVVPTARLAERLGMALADVWGALAARSEEEAGSSTTTAPVRSNTTRDESGKQSVP